MNYEKKECSGCNNITYIYNKKNNLCQYCYKKKRSEIWRQNSKPKKSYVIPVRSKKGKKTVTKDRVFFESIWKSRPHICENCYEDLGDQYNPVYFSHILTKAAYPSLRYNADNINILCFKCHQIWEFGKRKEMSIYKKNCSVIQTLKSLINN